MTKGDRILIFGIVTLVVLVAVSLFLRSRPKAPEAELAVVQQVAAKEKSVADLVEDLSSGDLVASRLAAYALGNRIYLNKDSIAQLIRATQDSDRKLRVNAIYALGKMEAASKPAIPKLILLLSVDDSLIQRAAHWALTQIPAGQKKDIPILLEYLESPNDAIRQASISELKKYGKDVFPFIQENLKQPNALSLPYVIETLGQMGSRAQVMLPELEALLDERDVIVREKAITAIGQMRQSAQKSEDKIRGILEDVHETLSVRVMAAKALLRIRPEVDLPMVSSLRQRIALAIQEGSPREAAEAIRAAGNLGIEMAPQLIAAANMDDPELRAIAATALGKAGPTATPTLLRLLDDVELEVRKAAFEALSQSEFQTQSGMQKLVDSLNHEDWEIRSQAIAALGKIGALALPVLQPAFLSEDSQIREGAILAAKQMSADATLPIASLLKKDDAQLQMTALEIIGDLGPFGEITVTEIGEVILRSRNREVQLKGIDVIAEMGPPAWRAVPFLIRATEDRSDDVRVAARNALKEIGTVKAKEALKSS